MIFSMPGTSAAVKYRDSSGCILSEDRSPMMQAQLLKQIRRSMKVVGERVHTQLAGMVSVRKNISAGTL